MQSDFIVIGSGIAGLTSSIILSHYGKVLVITKGKLFDTATNWAQGGVACAVEVKDSWQKHFKDTLIAGAGHNNKKAVKYLVKNATKAIDWLAKQGVPFEKKNGQYKTGREGGHSHNRIIHATDITGREIESALIKKVKENRSIIIWENAFAKKLIVKNKRCFGIYVTGPAAYVSQLRSSIASRNKDMLLHNRYSRSQGEARFVRQLTDRSRHPSQITICCFSKATILATGGLGQVYQWTTNPSVSTGDGIALACRVGAEISDLEFIQFHPTALKYRKSPLFLLSEALRGEGAYLVKIKNQRSKIKDTDKKLEIKETGERFMRNYDKRLELAPRDIVARTIFYEQQKGFEVYLDIRHKDRKFLQKRFPNIYKELKTRGYDMAKDLIPVTPAAHYSCGGIKTDLYGRTSVKNLYAFGEAACTGVHGANRLASNSLLEAVVFPLRLKGRISQLLCHSGKSRSSRDASRIHLGSWSHPDKIGIPQDDSLRNVKLNLQRLMWEKTGIVRTKKGLEKAKTILGGWEEELEKKNGLNKESLELKNMVQVAKLIIEACLNRSQSLGAHYYIN